MKTNLKAIREMAKQLERTRQATEERTRRARANKDEPDPLGGDVNPHAAIHGEYDRHNGRTTNHGSTIVARWIHARQLTESQAAGISHSYRLWEAAATTRRLVADFERVRGGESGGNGLRQQEALDDLKRISGGNDAHGSFKPGYIPPSYWVVYENCVRFDEPGGYGGSRLADVPQREIARCRTIVQFTADLIAQNERLSY